MLIQLSPPPPPPLFHAFEWSRGGDGPRGVQRVVGVHIPATLIRPYTLVIWTSLTCYRLCYCGWVLGLRYFFYKRLSCPKNVACLKTGQRTIILPLLPRLSLNIRAKLILISRNMIGPYIGQYSEGIKEWTTWQEYASNQDFACFISLQILQNFLQILNFL